MSATSRNKDAAASAANQTLLPPSTTAIALQPAQPNKYELRDLQAQENMVFWSMMMFVAAIATLLVTGFGTLLIWRQVRLTREAVEDTRGATQAMRDANEIARISNERQLRAYLGVASCSITEAANGNGFILQAELVNGGQTPAYDTKIMGESFGAEYPLEAEHPFSPLEDGYGCDVPPGGSIHCAYGLECDSTAATINSVVDGGLALYIQGVCQYRDAFGKMRETQFRYVFGGRIARTGGLVMHAAKTGNSSNRKPPSVWERTRSRAFVSC